MRPALALALVAPCLTVTACTIVQSSNDGFATGEAGGAASMTIGDDTDAASTGAHGTTGTVADSGDGDAGDSTTTGGAGTPTSTGPDADASSGGGESSGTSGDPPSACCGPQAGGCDDDAVAACVCAQDDYCCDAWDIACAIELEDFDCGRCGPADEVASCTALCEVFATCAPELGYATVEACLEGECLGLLDQATAAGDACVHAMTRYNACIGLLDCTGFGQYLGQSPPDAFPCAGFQADMFDACPFVGG